VGRKVEYQIAGDGKALASGTFGAWILGNGSLDLDVTGVKTLQLTTRSHEKSGALRTLLWGNARIVTRDGRELPLGDSLGSSRDSAKIVFENTVALHDSSADYQGGPIRIAGIPMATALPAEPENLNKPALANINLNGMDAVRLKATIGGDWPVGNEEQLRKVCSVRTKGREAQFLTLIEPYEKTAMVKEAVAKGPGQLRVELANGVVQEIEIRDLQGGGNLQVSIAETRGGKLVRQEQAVTVTP